VPSLSAADAVELPPNPWFSWDYVVDHVDELVAAGKEHLAITLASVALAMVVAVPLALVVRRYPRLRGPVLALGGVLYTIPALALISILWPVFGLTPVTVTIALAVYALLVVLRNTLVGLEGVPPDVVDAARGMGYGARRLLWRVELPLALPAILAGVRLAVVSTVGLVTIGALVGHGGFGTLIVGGFVDNFYHAQIMTATLLTVALAIVLEGLLLLLERVLTPWSRTRPAGAP
jgi:osmoprotectant transport system permease protein